MIYDIKVLTYDQKEITLEKYKNKVLLIVNTATRCGNTKQYTKLEELYQKYKDKGFEILDFPCNQFAGQAKEDIDKIHEFCTTKYNISFDQFDKIKVNGKDAHPLYNYLKEKTDGEKIRWNFAKFLIDRKGNIVKRYDPKVKPEDIEEAIIKILGE